MTEMRDGGPERIWAYTDEDGDYVVPVHSDQPDDAHTIEYVRADIYEALQARVAELEALPTLTTHEGKVAVLPSDYDTVRKDARAALKEE